MGDLRPAGQEGPGARQGQGLHRVRTPGQGVPPRPNLPHLHHGGHAKEKDEEKLAEDIIADTIRVGALPEGTSLKTFREKGIVRLTGLGMDAVGLNMATDIKPDETISPLKWHVRARCPIRP